MGNINIHSDNKKKKKKKKKNSQLSFPVISMCVSQQYEYVIAGEIFETILGPTPILMVPLVVFLSLVVYLPLVVYLHLVVLLVEVGGLGVVVAPGCEVFVALARGWSTVDLHLDSA